MSTLPTAARALRPGDWVAVRSAAEIAATLDAEGRLDGLPLMPEMLRFCGRHFRVLARADRTVVEKLGVRRMENTVHLEELRCDGAAHEGCSRRCLLFWKEAWLRPVPSLPATVAADATAPSPPTRDAHGWICQSTHLDRATRPQPLFDAGQFARAPAAEGVSPLVVLRSVGILAWDLASSRLGLSEWNTLPGPCTRTPSVTLGLRPGERVRVKQWRQILTTLDRHGWNRGMEFSREMRAYCGREMTVLCRVERLLRDQATQMVELRDTVALVGATYRALNRRAVPRREYMFWRECWLERVVSPWGPDRRAAHPGSDSSSRR